MNLAAFGFHDLFDERQANARTLFIRTLGLENIKNARLLLGIDTLAVVGNIESIKLSLFNYGDVDGAIGATMVLDTVAD